MIILILFALLLASALPGAPSTVPEDKTKDPDRLHYVSVVGGYTTSYDIDPGKSAGFDQMESYVKKDNPDVKTIDAMLESFGKDSNQEKVWGKLVRDFVLGYKSNAEEAGDVSPLTPRVIMHADRLFVGMTDGKIAEEKSGVAHDFQNRLPVVEWTGKRFALHLIQETPNGLEFIRNPPACNRCHDGRPIWLAYPFWPNFFGSDAGVLSEKEFQNLKDFLTKNATKGRYRFLKFPTPPESYIKEDGFKRSTVPNDPGFRLSFHLYHLNWLRVWHQIRDSKYFDERKWMILAALQGCPNLEKYFAVDKPPAKTEAMLTEDLVQSGLAYREYVLKNFSSDGFPLEITVEKPTVSRFNADFGKLAYVTQGTDVDVYTWALSFQPKRPRNVFLRNVTGAENLDDPKATSLHTYLRRRLEEELAGAGNELSCWDLLLGSRPDLKEEAEKSKRESDKFNPPRKEKEEEEEHILPLPPSSRPK